MGRVSGGARGDDLLVCGAYEDGEAHCLFC
jgi:hypothetical protein